MRKFLFILTSCFAFSAHADVLIGVGSPITGPIASWGEYIKIGVEMAAADINAKGGVLGQKIKLDVQDDACEPKQAVTVANKFVTEKALAAIGHICSGSSMPASLIYSENQVIHIEPSAMLEEITARRLPGIFRISAPNGKTGIYLADQMVQRFKPKTVAIVMEKRAITQELAAKTKARLSELGIKNIPEFTYNPGDRDFRVLANRLAEVKPDIVFMSAYTLEAGSLVRQAREARLMIPFIGYETIASADFGNMVGSKEDNVFFIDYMPSGETGKKLAQMVKEKKLPHDSAIYQGYASLQIFAEAAQRAGSLDYATVVKSMHSQSFDTAVGKIEFDDKGDNKNPALHFFQWKNGKRVELP